MPKNNSKSKEIEHLSTWEHWIKTTSIHGPLEAYKASNTVERSFWILLVLAMTAWTSYTVGNMIKAYFEEGLDYTTVAITPQDPKTFQLLRMAYCSSDWLNRTKANEMGIDDGLADYMELLLEATTGDGVGNLKMNLSASGVRSHLEAQHGRLMDLKDTLGFSSLRLMYEAASRNFSTYVLKKRLCLVTKSKVCKYRFYSQTTDGYTIRDGRVCQYLTPVKDKPPTELAFTPRANPMFVLRHHKQSRRTNFSVSFQPYIGELVTTGLSDIEYLFEDQIFIKPSARYCKIMLLVSVYEIQRVNTSRQHCMSKQNTKEPAYYPSLSCKLRCVDEVYYQKRTNCSIYHSLYITADQKVPLLPLCSVVELYDAFQSTGKPEDVYEYAKCVEVRQCRKRLPCKEYVGTVRLEYQHCDTNRGPRGEVMVVTELRPVNMMEIKCKIRTDFATAYSDVGGVMALALGASIVSIVDLICTVVWSLCTVISNRLHCTHEDVSGLSCPAGTERPRDSSSHSRPCLTEAAPDVLVVI